MNVPENMLSAPLVTRENKLAGIGVPPLVPSPVQPANVAENMPVAPVTVLAKLNNPDGIAVKAVQPSNVAWNKFDALLVICANKVDGIVVKLVQL